MNNKRHPQSVDGFVLRRRTAPQANANQLGVAHPALPDRFIRGGDSSAARELSAHESLPQPVLNQPPSGAVRKSEIDASLAEIDAQQPEQKIKKRRRLSKKKIALIILVIFIGIVGYFGARIIIAGSHLFSGNIFDLLGSGTVLKADENGRTNILIFGTSQDDPSHNDPNNSAGPYLTDSIMIASLDQKNKNVSLISVPRDLWVKYGEACPAGYEGKINALYTCFSNEGADETAGSEALMQEVGDDFGLQVQYFAHIDYTVVRQAVDAVGGVDINLQSSDPRGVLDRNFDWACSNGPYTCYYVKYPNGPVHLDGIHALYLARARNDSGGYGLPAGNFDREQNQQKILTALKTKATSAGTLANPITALNLLDSLGNNVKTDFTAGEVKTLINLGRDIPSGSIKSINLVDDGSAVMTTGSVSGQSVVRPVAGLYDFSQVQSYIQSKLKNDPISNEGGSVEVLNGSDFMGLAQTKANQLKDAGISNISTGDTDTSSAYGTFVWYDLSGGKKPLMLAKLKAILGTSPTGTSLPTGVQSTANFVIIVGNGVH